MPLRDRLKKFFQKFWFFTDSSRFLTKIPLKPPIEIENMPLRCDKTIRLYTSCLDALQNSNYIRFSIIFSYHIDILPRSIGKLPKNNQKRHRARDFFRRRVIFRVKGMGYLRKLQQFSNHISWRVFEQLSWKFVHILFQGYERS